MFGEPEERILIIDRSSWNLPCVSFWVQIWPIFQSKVGQKREEAGWGGVTRHQGSLPGITFSRFRSAIHAQNQCCETWSLVRSWFHFYVNCLKASLQGWTFLLFCEQRTREQDNRTQTFLCTFVSFFQTRASLGHNPDSALAYHHLFLCTLFSSTIDRSIFSAWLVGVQCPLSTRCRDTAMQTAQAGRLISAFALRRSTETPKAKTFIISDKRWTLRFFVPSCQRHERLVISLRFDVFLPLLVFARIWHSPYNRTNYSRLQFFFVGNIQMHCI